MRSVESQNDEVGMSLGWTRALALRFATGREVEGNRVRADFFDPATPTIAQREDALAKRKAAGVGREGYWDQLGWSEARKAKERAYFEAEAMDPLTRARLTRRPEVPGFPQSARRHYLWSAALVERALREAHAQTSPTSRTSYA